MGWCGRARAHNALLPFAITSFAELTWEQFGGKLDRELRAAFQILKAVVDSIGI